MLADITIYDIPGHLTSILEAYRVRPEGMTLEEWYMQQGPITPPAAEILAVSGAPHTWVGAATPPAWIQNGGNGNMAVEWDVYDIKAAARGKQEFLGPGDFPKLSQWALYAQEVLDVTGWTWMGTKYVPPEGGNGVNGDDNALIGLLAVVALFVL